MACILLTRQPCLPHACARCRMWCTRYDVDDPFIDDSEVQAHVAQVGKMNVQTKHSGFYVHSNTAIAAEGAEETRYDGWVLLLLAPVLLCTCTSARPLLA